MPTSLLENSLWHRFSEVQGHHTIVCIQAKKRAPISSNLCVKIRLLSVAIVLEREIASDFPCSCEYYPAQGKYPRACFASLRVLRGRSQATVKPHPRVTASHFRREKRRSTGKVKLNSQDSHGQKRNFFVVKFLTTETLIVFFENELLLEK